MIVEHVLALAFALMLARSIVDLHWLVCRCEASWREAPSPAMGSGTWTRRFLVSRGTQVLFWQPLLVSLSTAGLAIVWGTL